MFGSIMPEPLAMPPTRERPGRVVTVDGALLRKRIGRHDGAGRVAALAARQRGHGCAECPATTLSIGD